LTAGEVMQLPPTDELVLVSACYPIRAKKARYYEDARLKARVLPPPSLAVASEGTSGGRPNRGADDWSHLPVPASVEDAAEPIAGSFFEEDSDNSGIRREPTLPDHEAITAEEPKPRTEFTFPDEADDDAARTGALRQRFGTVARQAALDPDDGIPL
jgi:type IV secretion system protein VirD4